MAEQRREIPQNELA